MKITIELNGELEQQVQRHMDDSQASVENF